MFPEGIQLSHDWSRAACVLCSVVSDYRGKHYPGSRECQLPCTAPTASPGSTHPPPMLQQEAAPATQGLQVPNRLAWAGLCTPLQRPPPCNFPSTACSFLLHRGEGERAPLQRSLWEASLQSHPEQGLAYQELQRHSLCTRDGIATATTPHRNQVYLFNLKEKKRFSCNNSQTELLVDY